MVILARALHLHYRSLRNFAGQINSYSGLYTDKYGTSDSRRNYFFHQGGYVFGRVGLLSVCLTFGLLEK